MVTQSEQEHLLAAGHPPKESRVNLKYRVGDGIWYFGIVDDPLQLVPGGILEVYQKRYLILESELHPDDTYTNWLTLVPENPEEPRLTDVWLCQEIGRLSLLLDPCLHAMLYWDYRLRLARWSPRTAPAFKRLPKLLPRYPSLR